RDPGLDEPADRGVEDVVVRGAAVQVVVTPLGDAHVHRLDQRPGRIGGGAPGGGPVQAAGGHAPPGPPRPLQGARGAPPAPRATPTTPLPLSIAPTVPATCVPWPFPSHQAARFEVEQLTPPTTFRSARRAIPVSTIATSASTR